jgi:uncharacterized protein (TIGR03503 family)
MSVGRWLLAVVLLATGAAAHAAAPATDVRVVIDVSGSMKQNDPHNLRAPALRLLVNLLPPDSSAGVWMFAQGVDALVPVAPADAAWRRKAVAASRAIHSRGLFTDIGAGLEAATQDWRQAPPAGERVLILLTDGMVDVSKQKDANAAARARILSHTLPELRAAQVAVHAVALSSNADAELLRTLALGTDGSFEQTDDAAMLERLFLRLFERSVPRNTLPLVGNRFQVDASVEELTLLAFRRPGAAATRLRNPAGKEFDASSAPPTSRWHAEAGYDLVTVAQPEAGEWMLVGDSDPDNRVMVLTSLQLVAASLPDNLFAGEQLAVQARLTEGDSTISRAEFLQLVKVELEQAGPGAGHHWQLDDNGLAGDHAAGDGTFTAQLAETLTPGHWELVTRARGATFQREQRQRISVAHAPVSATATPVEGQPGAFQLRFQQTVPWVDSQSLRIGARVPGADGRIMQIAAVETDPEQWQIDLAGLDASRAHLVELEVGGRTTAGREFKLTLPSLTLPATAPSVAPQPQPAGAVAPDETDVNWLVVIIVLVTGNVALLATGGLGLYLYRSRKRPPMPLADDESASTPAANEEPA